MRRLWLMHSPADTIAVAVLFATYNSIKTLDHAHLRINVFENTMDIYSTIQPDDSDGTPLDLKGHQFAKQRCNSHWSFQLNVTGK